jgi:hypothetical protein
LRSRPWSSGRQAPELATRRPARRARRSKRAAGIVRAK